MRFIDANVFIYACYNPKRQLDPTETEMKREPKAYWQAYRKATKR